MHRHDYQSAADLLGMGGRGSGVGSRGGDRARALLLCPGDRRPPHRGVDGRGFRAGRRRSVLHPSHDEPDGARRSRPRRGVHAPTCRAARGRRTCGMSSDGVVRLRFTGLGTELWAGHEHVAVPTRARLGRSGTRRRDGRERAGVDRRRERCRSTRTRGLQPGVSSPRTRQGSQTAPS